MIVTVKFNTLVEANYWCRGGIFIGCNAKQLVKGLVGQTITFTAPSGSCTFTQPTNTPTGLMDFISIKTQLEAAVTGLKLDTLGDKSVLYQGAGTAAVTLAAVNEGGRVPLGLANNQAEAGVFLSAPGGTVPSLVGFVTDSQAAYITYVK